MTCSRAGPRWQTASCTRALQGRAGENSLIAAAVNAKAHKATAWTAVPTRAILQTDKGSELWLARLRCVQAGAALTPATSKLEPSPLLPTHPGLRRTQRGPSGSGAGLSSSTLSECCTAQHGRAAGAAGRPGWPSQREQCSCNRVQRPTCQPHQVAAPLSCVWLRFLLPPSLPPIRLPPPRPLTAQSRVPSTAGGSSGSCSSRGCAQRP